MDARTTPQRVLWSYAARDARLALARREECVTAVHRTRPSIDAFVSQAIYGELVGNVVRHGRGPIAVTVLDDGKTTLVVSAFGPAFAFAPRRPSPDAESGRGHAIVAALAVAVSLRRTDDGGNVVEAVLEDRSAA